MKISTSKKNKNFFLFFEGKKVPIHQKITIGSTEGDLLIKEQEVSKKHCTFYHEGQSVTLVDHNSLSGTYIGQIRIHPERKVFLLDKDLIRIGNTILEIKSEEDHDIKNFHQIHTDNSPEKQSSFTELAGISSRFFALFIDLSVTYFIQDFFPRSLLEQFQWIPFLEKNKELFHFYSVFIIIQSISTLLLKVSLGQYIFNFSSKSYFKSFLRNLLGIFTLPFLVFDVPLLFGKESFKEILTSNIQQNKTVPLLGYLITFFILPLFFYVEPLKDLTSSKYISHIHKEDHKELESTTVNFFYLKFFSPLKIYPFFDKVEYSKTNAAIRVFNSKEQIKISFIKKVFLKNMIENIKLYPFFLRGTEKNFFYLQEENFSENFLKTIIKTLKLDFFQGLSSFKEYFPYYKHLLDFKKILLTIFEVDALENVILARFNNNLYMIVKKEFYYFLPLRFENLILYGTDCTSFEQLSSFLSFIDYGQEKNTFFPLDYFLTQKKSLESLLNYYNSVKKTVEPLFFETLKSEILLLSRETQDKDLEAMILKL